MTFLIFCILRCFDILGPGRPWEGLSSLDFRTPPPNDSWFLEIVKDLPTSMPLICTPSNPEFIALIGLSSGSWSPGHYSSAWNHPRARYLTTRDHPYYPLPAEMYSNCPILNLLSAPILSHPFFPHENNNKSSDPCFSLAPSASWPTLLPLRVVLAWCVARPPLENC